MYDTINVYLNDTDMEEKNGYKLSEEYVYYILQTNITTERREIGSFAEFNVIKHF